MKALLITALLFSSTAFAAPLFSEAQHDDVLTEIDNICGDSWCEGDYNFQFNSFSCIKETHTCELNFQFIKTEEDESQTFSPEQVCSFSNIKKFSQLKDSKWSLNVDFYEAVSDCISEKEESLRF